MKNAMPSKMVCSTRNIVHVGVTTQELNVFSRIGWALEADGAARESVDMPSAWRGAQRPGGFRDTTASAQQHTAASTRRENKRAAAVLPNASS
jgi:hypothetical protein